LSLLYPLTGCGEKTDKSVELLVWLDATAREEEFYKGAFALFSELEPGITIRPEFISFNQLKPKLTGLNDQTRHPDSILVINDWLGELSDSGVLSPVTLPAETPKWARIPVTHSGRAMAVPMAFEVAALVYNRMLIPKPPESFEEFMGLVPSLKASGIFPLMYDNKNFYFHAPFFHAFGAAIPGEIVNGAAAAEVFTSPEAQHSFDYALNLEKSGLVPDKSSASAAVNLFCAGQCAAIITGPWTIPEIRRNRIDFRVAPIPKMDGRLPRPFLGIKAFGVTSSSTHPQEARKFALFMAGPQVADLARREGLILPVRDFASAAEKSDQQVQEYIMGFAGQAAQSIPLPTHRAMRAVWREMNWALTEIFEKKQMNPETITAAAQRIRDSVDRYLKENLSLEVKSR